MEGFRPAYRAILSLGMGFVSPFILLPHTQILVRPSLSRVSPLNPAYGTVLRSVLEGV